MIEFVNPQNREKYEQFVSTHPHGGFTQSLKWHEAKKGWGWEAFMATDDTTGEVRGAQLVLIKTLPFGFSFLYSPRGPVCDWEDEAVMDELLGAVKALAKKYKAYRYTMDPELPEENTAVTDRLLKKGFSLFKGGESGLEAIQARFNYQLPIADKDCDELLMSFHSKTRYNIRVAIKHEVEVRVCGEEALEDFARLMAKTGERDGFVTRPKEYFKTFLDALGENARLYMCYYRGQPVSGAISVFYAGKACYVYGASDNEHRNVMPNYLMQWEMIRYAKSLGCTLYDFQGVSGNLREDDPEYGLYRFKKGFNGFLAVYAGEFSLVFKPLVDRGVTWADHLRCALRKIGH